MNHEGRRTGQVNLNSNIQTEVNTHLSIGSLQRLHPSSRSLIAGSDQRFPDRLSRPNINHPGYSANINILPNNGRGVGVSLHQSTGGLGLNISSQNSLTRTLQCFPDRPFGSNVLHYQGTTRSIPQSNVDSTARHVWNNNPSVNLGVHGGISTNMMRSPFKRRSTDDSSREFFVGESSIMGAEAGIAKRRVVSSHFNANNNVNISSLYNVPRRGNPRNFEAEIGHSSITPVSDMQYARVESFHSNINVQITTPTTPQAFIHVHRSSNGYTRGVQVPLRRHAPLFFQTNRHPSLSSSENVQQPFQYAPNNVSSGNTPLQNFPFYSGTGREATVPLHNQGNIMLGPQPQIGSGTPSFLGNVPNLSEQYGSFTGNVNVSNAPELIPIERMSPEHPSVDPSEISQQMERSFGVFNYRAQNGHTSVAISEIQGDTNFEALDALSPLDRAEMRRRLASQIQRALENLSAGRTLQFQELLLLNYTLVSHLLDARDQQQNEGQGVAQQQNEEANTGLTEEQIMTYIRHENFKSVSEETPENKEACCICQEYYVGGEQVGRLDCMHIFHIGCIIGWLRRKNQCPICKRKGLIVIDEDGDE